MKIICVVGARPNFMKAAPVIEALKAKSGIEVMLVHTGQHYDRQMSQLFFEELGMPVPDLDLHVGSGSHGEQTGQIMIRFEPILKEHRPDMVMVFGDVNSTVAAALCASKLGILVAHVEAGLRSGDRTMPEEINRILTDHLSDFLFTTEESAHHNLAREGIPDTRIFFVGNVMVDTLLKHRERAMRMHYCQTIGLSSGGYSLLTLHRPSNVDDSQVLGRILQAIFDSDSTLPVVFPCHPRTRQRLAGEGLAALVEQQGQSGKQKARLVLLEPLGYLEFLSLMSSARFVLTDSGGIQEETTVLGVPCLTLRENTERPVTLTQGTNVLVGNDRQRILSSIQKVLSTATDASSRPPLWDGHAAERIAEVVTRRVLASCS
jgi:UDP-N-acetylglucosamine 2-epimerase (non-hydrolysing)